MAVLSFADLPELKDIAKKYGYTLHMRDACGGQSFSMEESGTPDDSVFQEIDRFFSVRGMKTEYFGEDKLNFVAR